MTALNNLLFRVSLLDNMSGPARNMMSTMDRVTSNIQGGFNKIGYGAAGLWGIDAAIEANTEKAIKFESAMAAVNKVVDFPTPKAFKDFGSDILKMSRTIPISAEGLAEIAAAGGEQGIQLLDLPGFVSTVAKMSTAFDMGTSQAGESIGKLANIYNIPIQQIGSLGDAINHLSNNTNAKASDMVDVLSRVGGISGQFGISVNQTAALSAAMLSLGQPAEVAGTAINAMLLKLNTARNQSKGFTEALSGIGLSVGQLEKNIAAGPQQAIDDFLARIAKLNKHDQALVLGDLFGAEYSDNLAILVGGLDKYQKTLGLVGDATKYQGSMQNEFNIKASTTENMLQLFKNHWDNILISAGTIFLPKIVEWVGKFNEKLAVVADTITRWSSLFPNITSLIGTAAVVVVGITAALSLLSIAVGLGSIVAEGFGLAWAAIGFILTPLAPLFTALRMAWVVMKMEMLAGSGVFTVLKTGLVAFGTQLWTNIAAIWAWNVALFANPITWIVLGIAALIGIVAAAVIYWDTWTQAVSDWFSAFDAFYLIGQGIGLIILQFKLIGQAIGWVVAGFQAIPDWWNGFKAWVSTLDPFAQIGDGIDLMIAGFDAIKNWWSEFKNWLTALNPFAGISSAADSVMSGIQSVTGFKMPGSSATQPPVLDKLSTPSTVTGATAAPSLSAMASQPKWMQQPAPGLLTDGFAPPQSIAAPAALTQSGAANVPRGGLMSQINNADNSKSVNVGGITINNPPKPVTGQFLADELQMAAG
jgi:TP901 family phage tail tape measure protein